MRIKFWDNKILNLDLPAELFGSNLIALPALVDPHVHFRMPGGENKEDWQTAAQAAIAGGVTTVFDMPNNTPAIVDEKALLDKKKLIDSQLAEAEIPLRYHLYFGATPDNLDEIEKVKNQIIGIKLFMGSSTGDLLVDKKEDQERVFKKAAELNLLVAVHAEDEECIRESVERSKGLSRVEPRDQKIKRSDGKIAPAKLHSKIRSREAAVKAVTQALGLARKYATKLYILHVSAKEELDLIRQAKNDGINVYAEATPHHLILNENDYARLGTKAQMNPPLRTKADNDALWQAIKDGTIDTVGTDHAPHTLAEKNLPYGQAPSGVPGIENYLAILLNAHHEGKITLEKIVELTHDNPQKIFGLEANDDLVIVDLDKTRVVRDGEQKTKCKWSPYAGMMLRGWAVAVVLRGRVYGGSPTTLSLHLR
ncbi:MAG: dihydroorotase [Patescibacteria group bacterium]